MRSSDYTSVGQYCNIHRQLTVQMWPNNIAITPCGSLFLI